jgi:hypothetical protein
VPGLCLQSSPCFSDLGLIMYQPCGVHGEVPNELEEGCNFFILALLEKFFTNRPLEKLIPYLDPTEARQGD